VVLGDEDEIEAGLLGRLDLLDPLFEETLPITGAGVGPFVKDAKLHAGILQVTA
jgi:hypothetical protein